MLAERLRVVQKFWLDVLKPEERDLAKYIERLKAERQFLPTIRDGLRLIRDLRAGNIDVLCELFPWVADKFRSQDSKLSSQIERLEKLMLQQGARPVAMGRALVEPVALDGDTQLIEVKEAKKDGRAALNFINSLQKLNGLQTFDSVDQLRQTPAKSPPVPGAPKRIEVNIAPSADDDEDDLSLEGLL